MNRGAVEVSRYPISIIILWLLSVMFDWIAFDSFRYAVYTGLILAIVSMVFAAFTLSLLKQGGAASALGIIMLATYLFLFPLLLMAISAYWLDGFFISGYWAGFIISVIFSVVGNAFMALSKQ